MKMNLNWVFTLFFEMVKNSVLIVLFVRLSFHNQLWCICLIWKVRASSTLSFSARIQNMVIRLKYSREGQPISRFNPLSNSRTFFFSVSIFTFFFGNIIWLNLWILNYASIIEKTSRFLYYLYSNKVNYKRSYKNGQCQQLIGSNELSLNHYPYS